MKKKTSSSWGTTVLVIFLLLAVLGFGAYGLHANRHVSGVTRTYTFTRVLSEDLGASLDPSQIKADNADVTLDTIFTERSRGEYGADTKQPDGLGLNVYLFEKDTPTSAARQLDSVQLRAWKKKNDFGEDNPARRKAVQVVEQKFDSATQRFCAKRDIVKNLGVIVDTTNGPEVNNLLADKVELALNARQLRKFIEAGQTVNLYGQLLSEYSYPNSVKNFPKATLADLAEFVAWVRSAPETKESSIYSGLSARMEEMRKQGVNEFIIFTDGIENVAGKDGLSLYGHPELLGDQKAVLNAYFAKHFGLDVSGLTIDLHPIPPRKRPDLRRIDETTQPPSLSYLGEQLGVRKAKVSLNHS